MSRIAYVNGRYLPQAQAVTSIEDRGYQFADGVYEYVAYYNRRFLDFGPHMARLRENLAKLAIAEPMGERALSLVCEELIARNGQQDGGLYLQVTRGAARRDHPFPPGVKPVLSMSVHPAKTPKEKEVREGVSVIVRPDIRWGRCDAKTVLLLPNVLAKQEAAQARAREAWLTLPDGTVTEGSVSNAFIVTAREGVVTHPADAHVLPGITRNVVLALARANGIGVSERPFSIDEARGADEAFLTSTSANVLPVTRIEGAPVGAGKPGAITRTLLALYLKHVHAQTGKDLT